ncbi:unnamed protein product [Spirodela intermedia]|uniref:Glutamyl-tRNA(Gln) amidotransferase subunit C, chloroplastic/mitochondrial n=1 Tax=Spirodela intermedia TaxID=51605 RepID=A0A7I8I862_SPIIN|nr:unnamed protein product [Spirodela intermedia]CAA6653760.1 unnamed protein product [Spirodela intermedia]
MITSVIGFGAASGVAAARMAGWARYSLHTGLRSYSPSSRRLFCSRTYAALEPPNVHRLAETARISVSPEEVEEFTPKIRQVVDWFGQLQAVDLESIDPALRVDTIVNDNLREDVPESFDNRPAMLAAVPSFEEPYIKVPRVLNKE